MWPKHTLILLLIILPACQSGEAKVGFSYVQVVLTGPAFGLVCRALNLGLAFSLLEVLARTYRSSRSQIQADMRLPYKSVQDASRRKAYEHSLQSQKGEKLVLCARDKSKSKSEQPQHFSHQWKPRREDPVPRSLQRAGRPGRPEEKN